MVLQADGWRAAADFDELGKGVPESLTAMIHQKMDTLSPEEQLLLEAASVAGREFVASVLASGLGWTEDDTELRCATLARQGTFIRDAGVLEWPGGSISARFRFIHALYREAVYGRVPAGRRSRLHRLIGEELEKAYGARGAMRTRINSPVTSAMEAITRARSATSGSRPNRRCAAVPIAKR